MPIDPPTIQMQFAVNDGPLAGIDGQLVTARHIWERLVKEVRTNVALRIAQTDAPNIFNVSGRGEMQIAILVEQMRREGHEVLVSRPEVIYRKDAKGNLLEPIEQLFLEIPKDAMGVVLENLAGRKGEITTMHHHGDQVSIEALIPMRGLIGFETDLVNQTRGLGVMSHLFHEYGPDRGEIAARKNGSLVSMEAGEAMSYALNMIQERGRLMVEPGDAIYAGMIVGENARENDIPVNPCKAKKLTNMRSQGDGKGIQLNPPLKMSLERALEYIGPDEYVEATPKNLRLRKKILDEVAAQARRAKPRGQEWWPNRAPRARCRAGSGRQTPRRPISGRRPFLRRSGRRRGVADQVVDVVLELGAPHLEFLDFLIRGEINFLLDAIDLVVQTVILVVDVPEVVVRTLESPDGLTMLRKLAQDGMMKVHGSGLLLFSFSAWFVGVACPRTRQEQAGKSRFSLGSEKPACRAGRSAARPFVLARRQPVDSRLCNSIRGPAAVGGLATI